MLKNIAASALVALCILAVSASAGAQGVIDGITGAAEDIIDGAADAGRDIADGLSAGTDDPNNSSDVTSSDPDTSDPDTSDPDASDPDISDPDTSDSDSSDSEPEDTSSDTVISGANGSNPDTGISFGYVAGAAVLGALGVAVTVNKRRS
ncbi:MAG: hypothetical protein J1F03_08330 [Oscillospiraceae bacterium]|nr:hypothetical protein [Oscillospiraceae bacterium]